MPRPLAPASVLLAPRHWPIHLLALVCAAAAVAMGVWQYDAWQTRRAEAAVDLTDKSPLPVTDLIGPDDPFPADAVGRPAIVAGSWLPDATFYVSGREAEGRDGYWVVTPIEVEETGSALLVVRGWTADPDSAPPAPTGSGELTGWLQPGEGSTEPDPDRADDVVPQLRVADAAQRLSQDLYGAFVIADRSSTAGDGAEVATEGLEPATLDQLPPVGAFTSIRNLLYALEWWVFALFAVYAWWRWVRDVREEDADGDADEEADVPEGDGDEGAEVPDGDGAEGDVAEGDGDGAKRSTRADSVG